jgi:uncharacterized protein with FMN-binding domain
MKNLSATGVMSVENEKIRYIVRRVQDLMKNAEHSYKDGQRSTSLESDSLGEEVSRFSTSNPKEEP